MKFGILALGVLLPFCALLADEATEQRLANLRLAEEWDKQQAQREGVSLARPAVVALKGEGCVELLIEATGLGANGTVEFALVGAESDRGYEALAYSLARASDITAALESLGVPRGLNVNGRENRFWPRGERIYFEARPFDEAKEKSLPLEAYIYDKRSSGVLRRDGFVYCGSARRGTNGEELLADSAPPMAIISMYNEPQTLFDVPRMAAQGEVYESFVANPERLMQEGKLYLLTIRPEKRSDGSARVMAVALNLKSGEGNGGVVFECAFGADKPQSVAALADVLKLMMQRAKEGHDLFVTLSFDEALPLGRVAEICRALEMVEGEAGLRIEPPLQGQIFYKSFLPDEKWRVREKRLSQPWELRVGAAPGDDDKATSALTLVQIMEDWSDPKSLDPKLTASEFPLKSAEAVAAKVKELGGGLPVLLVFAKNEMPLSAFMPTVRLLRESQPIVYIFGE